MSFGLERLVGFIAIGLFFAACGGGPLPEGEEVEPTPIPLPTAPAPGGDTAPGTLSIQYPPNQSYVRQGVSLKGLCKTGSSLTISGAGLSVPQTLTCTDGNFSVTPSLSLGEGLKAMVVTQTVGNDISSINLSVTRKEFTQVIFIAQQNPHQIASFVIDPVTAEPLSTNAPLGVDIEVRKVVAHPTSNYLYALTSENSLRFYAFDPFTGILQASSLKRTAEYIVNGQVVSQDQKQIPFDLVFHPAGTHAFLNRKDSAIEDYSISAYSVSAASGNFQILQDVTAGDNIGSVVTFGVLNNPSEMIMHPNGRRFYLGVVNQETAAPGIPTVGQWIGECVIFMDMGGLIRCLVTPNGATQTLTPASHVLLNPLGIRLYSGDSASTAGQNRAINPNLMAPDFTVGTNFTAQTFYLSAPLRGAFSSLGNFLFLNAGADLNNDGRIVSYSVNATTGALTQGPTYTPAAGSGPFRYQLLSNRSANFLYALNKVRSQILTFSVNGTTGALTATASFTKTLGGTSASSMSLRVVSTPN